MTARTKRRGKGGGGRFLMLYNWFTACPAWRTLAPGPRVLYLELKTRFNGANNGALCLSHRQAAEALGVHRNTVGPWFRELAARGFITAVRAPCLGPAGIGETALWALGEEAVDGQPAAKGSMRWQPPEKQKPRTKNRTARHKKQDGPTKSEAETSPKQADLACPVLKIVTAAG